MKKLASLLGKTPAIPLLFRYNTSEIINSGDSFYDATGEYYSSLFADKKRDDISFYVSIAKDNGGPVLEAACGDGRILIPVAAAGLEVTGNDISPGMLEICRKRMQEVPEQTRNNIQICRGDMKHLPFRSRFRTVFLPYNSFNHLLNNEEQISCLRGLYNALEPGGMLVMEVLPYHKHYDMGLMMRKRSYNPSEKTKIIMYSRLEQDKENSLHTVNWFTVIKKKKEKPRRMITTFTRKDTPLETIRNMINENGFTIENIFYDYDRNTERGDKRIIAAARD
ncbi:class I SAM-dependent methyltransferase [candidate division KSB1 bacterium]